MEKIYWDTKTFKIRDYELPIPWEKTGCPISSHWVQQPDFFSSFFKSNFLDTKSFFRTKLSLLGQLNREVKHMFVCCRAERNDEKLFKDQVASWNSESALENVNRQFCSLIPNELLHQSWESDWFLFAGICLACTAYPNWMAIPTTFSFLHSKSNPYQTNPKNSRTFQSHWSKHHSKFPSQTVPFFSVEIALSLLNLFLSMTEPAKNKLSIKCNASLMSEQLLHFNA